MVQPRSGPHGLSKRSTHCAIHAIRRPGAPNRNERRRHWDLFAARQSRLLPHPTNSQPANAILQRAALMRNK
jgi:hypothetical protein